MQWATRTVLPSGEAGLKGDGRLSSNYNTRNRPPELMVDGDQVHVVRRRETLEDQLAPESCLPE